MRSMHEAPVNGQVYERRLELFLRDLPETPENLRQWKLMGRDADGHIVELRSFTDHAQLEAALEDLRNGVDVYAVVRKAY